MKKHFNKVKQLYEIWQENSPNRQIFLAGLIIALGTLLVKLFSLVKELILAYQFGTDDVLDAFFIAFLLPSFAAGVIGGSFNAAFIPTFIQVRDQKGIEEAKKLFSNVIIFSSLLLGLIALFFIMIGPKILPILGSGFDVGKQELTRSLFYLLLPSIFFSGLITIFGSVLNAGERFAVAAVAPSATPIATIIVLYLASDSLGIHALALGLILGFMVELILLGYILYRKSYFIRIKWYKDIQETKQVMEQYLPTVAGALLMSGASLIDQSMAAMLESGSVAILNYSNKVVALILGISSTALGTAVLPYFSKMIAVTNWKEVRRTYFFYSKLILIICIPLTIMLVFLSEEIVRTLFERGAFNAEDSQAVGYVQALYFIQLPFYMLGILGVRLLSSFKKNHILMWISLLNLITNVLGNYILMQYIGVAGIALSTSIVYMISSAVIFYSTLKTINKVYSPLVTGG